MSEKSPAEMPRLNACKQIDDFITEEDRNCCGVIAHKGEDGLHLHVFPTPPELALRIIAALIVSYKIPGKTIMDAIKALQDDDDATVYEKEILASKDSEQGNTNGTVA